MFGMEIFLCREVGESDMGHGVVGEKRLGLGEKGWEGNAMDKKVLIISFKSLIISFWRK